MFNFLKKQKNILVEDKYSPVFQHDFLQSEENVDLHNFQHYGGKCCWKC